jgi:hypothetical protein
MRNPSAFDNSIRREERSALHTELLRRLQQHGVSFPIRNASDAALADLLSAVEDFERTVEDAGGDLFVDSPDSSEPEQPNFVLPHPRDDERVEGYIKRVTDATRSLKSRH